MQGKTIQVYLMDGGPSQRIKCTLSGWIGVIYKIPRLLLKECKEGSGDIVKHLKHAGIYFLLGRDSGSKGAAIYIGQAVVRKYGGGLIDRIFEHDRNSKERFWDAWDEVVVLTTQNDSFGPTEISYLENQFTELARKANRYLILNGNDPNQGNVMEEKETELQEYIKYAHMIIGVLGYTVFNPLQDSRVVSLKTRSTESTSSVNHPIFGFTGKTQARGRLTNDGFILLKGSKISPQIQPSAKRATIIAREKYRNKTVDGVTTEDILFSSPSAAACFVGGCSLNGNKLWRTDDGKSPKDF